MPVKVLVVDDSRFYRNRLCEILSSDPSIKIIGTAENGREGLDKALSLKPDVITMDIEMPEMDGISAVREIMKQRPTPILMFSSLTSEGAQATLDALDAGAVDFLLKRLDKLSGKKSEFTRSICEKIRTLAGGKINFTKRNISRNESENNIGANTASIEKSIKPYVTVDQHSRNYKIIVIGASTGGPVAVQTITSALPENFPLPILIVQHMPAAFTKPFAGRLNALSRLMIKEAEEGDILVGGKVYVAPGGKQMLVDGSSRRHVIRIRESFENEQYKPSVDITYKSVSEVYGKDVLAIILTGMGSDGRVGAANLKTVGSKIWAQDEHTSVVYGMPQAVVEAGLVDRVLPINEIARQLALGV